MVVSNTGPEIPEDPPESNAENRDHIVPPDDMPWIDLRKLPETAHDCIRVMRRVRYRLANQRFVVYRPGIFVHYSLYLHLQFNRRAREQRREPQATQDQCSFQKGSAYVGPCALESTNLGNIAVLGEHLVERG